jgi:cobalt-zinc-cadmium efflux system protein
MSRAAPTADPPVAADCSTIRAHVRGGEPRACAHDAAGGHGHAGHAHAHGAHDHAHGASTRALRIALVLTALLLVGEVIGGFMSNSLALLADAGHMLTDVGALALSLFVAWFRRRPRRRTATCGGRSSRHSSTARRCSASRG